METAPVLRSCQGIRPKLHRCHVEPASQLIASPRPRQCRRDGLPFSISLLSFCKAVSTWGSQGDTSGRPATHGHRSSRPPSTLLQTHLSPVESSSCPLPLGTSRQCQGQATGLCPFQSGCSCPRSPPAEPGPPLRKAHVPSRLPMLLPPLPRPSLLTRE